MNIVETALSYENKSRDDLNLHESTQWCAETVSSIIKKSDISNNAKDVTSISCNQMFKAMQKSIYWYEPEDTIKIGDIIFFNWYHDYDVLGDLDHVGVVIEVHTDYIVTIEGNTEGIENWRTVKRKIRRFDSLNFNCKYPDYYMRYKEIETPVINSDMDKIKAIISEMRKLFNQLDTLIK